MFDWTNFIVRYTKKGRENMRGKTTKEQGQHLKIQEKGRKEILIERKKGKFTKKIKKKWLQLPLTF